MKLKINPPYKHLIQKPVMCGPTSIQMVLFRRGIWVDQEELAFEIGAKVWKGRGVVYRFPFEETDDDLEVGIVLHNFIKLNQFFEKRKINLKAETYLISQIENPEEFIVARLKEGSDVIAYFVVNILIEKREAGHFSPIAGIDIDKKEVTLCDPYPNNKSMYTIRINELVKRMSKGYIDEMERGFVVVSEK